MGIQKRSKIRHPSNFFAWLESSRKIKRKTTLSCSRLLLTFRRLGPDAEREGARRHPRAAAGAGSAAAEGLASGRRRRREHHSRLIEKKGSRKKKSRKRLLSLWRFPCAVSFPEMRRRRGRRSERVEEGGLACVTERESLHDAGSTESCGRVFFFFFFEFFFLPRAGANTPSFLSSINSFPFFFLSSSSLLPPRAHEATPAMAAIEETVVADVPSVPLEGGEGATETVVVIGEEQVEGETSMD